jgi:hypothetical protein
MSRPRAVVEPQLDAIVGPELQIRDRFGPVGQPRQKGVEILGRGVVRAWRADDMKLLEPQLRLDPAQRIDLARDADQRDPLVPGCRRRLQQRQQRRIAHAHPARPGHRRGVGHDDRLRPPAVVGVGADAKHRIDQPVFQQARAQPGRDSGPLRASEGRLQRGAVHCPERAEENLVGQLLVARAAMHGRLHRRVIGLQELAGLAALPRHRHPRQPAIGAHLARLGRGQRGRGKAGAILCVAHTQGFPVGFARQSGAARRPGQRLAASRPGR